MDGEYQDVLGLCKMATLDEEKTRGGRGMSDHIKDIEHLASCLQQLQAIQDEDNDRRAAGLYRAMFKNEFDINKLDWKYTDHILGYAEMGCEAAAEDYRNYLQYLKRINKEEYLAHKKMFDEAMNPKEEEDEV